MRFCALPVEQQLEALGRDSGPAAMEAEKHRLVTELIATQGFQIVVGLLRNVEIDALTRLRAGSGDPVEHVSGIRTVDFIRTAITAIAQAPINWSDEQVEEFMPTEYAEF